VDKVHITIWRIPPALSFELISFYAAVESTTGIHHKDLANVTGTENATFSVVISNPSISENLPSAGYTDAQCHLVFELAVLRHGTSTLSVTLSGASKGSESTASPLTKVLVLKDFPSPIITKVSPEDTQYARALRKIFEAGGQPVKNREMRSLAQRGNQAKFFHRMPGIQRSSVAYNLQHLREYNSCRIWASQSRRPPYVADVEGRARIEGVAASIQKSYMDAHGNKVAEDAVFKTLCVVIIFDEAPRYWEVQSKPESKHPIVKVYRDRASSQAATREETRSRTRSVLRAKGGHDTSRGEMAAGGGDS